MRYGLLAVLIGAATLGGCTDGVLDPKGPIALAERQILLNALGIMLAIVIPVILATLGVAFWFRASNERARYRPNFTYSGRLELLVWSVPAMTVLLVDRGGNSSPLMRASHAGLGISVHGELLPEAVRTAWRTINLSEV